MQHKKIVFLASDCESSRWVYNALKRNFKIATTIIEQPVSKKTLFKNRVKKIGYFKALGQVLFSLLVVPVLKKRAGQRKAAIIRQYHLSGTGFDVINTYNVASVNDDKTRQLLQSLQPDIVVVNGTRIICKNILASTNSVFINMHVGITPWYRGSHGGYWALQKNDRANFGTTIHIIDTGVDTGAVLKQVFTEPAKEDNFASYPVLQAAIGIEALKEVLVLLHEGKYEPKKHAEKGSMYYQPTIWQYFFGS